MLGLEYMEKLEHALLRLRRCLSYQSKSINRLTVDSLKVIDEGGFIIISRKNGVILTID